MNELAFHDERFTRGGLHEKCTAGRYAQKCLIEHGRIFCETLTMVDCSADRAIREIQGPWDWWENGAVSEFQAGSGFTTQVLSPVAGFITRVCLRQSPAFAFRAAEFPEWEGYRIPILMSRHFRGTATMDIIRKPGDGVILRGRFHAVQNHVPGVPVRIAAKMHVRAEAGNLMWPMPRRTGFPGLISRLEGIQDRISRLEPQYA